MNDCVGPLEIREPCTDRELVPIQDGIGEALSNLYDVAYARGVATAKEEMLTDPKLTRTSLLMRLHTAEMELAYVYPAVGLLGCRLCGARVEYAENAQIPHKKDCIFHGIRDGQ